MSLDPQDQADLAVPLALPDLKETLELQDQLALQAHLELILLYLDQVGLLAPLALQDPAVLKDLLV